MSCTQKTRNNFFNKNITKENKNENYILQEKLSEAEVAITEYVSSTRGFSGIIRARYSDFHVNEIDLQGNIAKLTDITPPEDFSAATDDIKTDKSILEQFSADIPEKIDKILSTESSEPLEVDITMLSKEERMNIHQAVKACYGSAVVAQTIIKDEKKFLKIEKYNNANKSDNRQRWPKGVAEYVHFLVYKECLDTMGACMRISSALHVRASNINYAGVKDRRAKTTQWFSIKKVSPYNIFHKTKHLRNIHIGNFTFKDKPLKLGQLQGNRFKIALRNVVVEDDVIDSAMKTLKENGFINYYGLQRFGCDKEIPTFAVGIKLLQGDWKEACQLILKPRQSEHTNSDISKAKKVFAETSDASKALKEFSKNRNNCIEFRLLQGLSKNNKNDYVNALENIPRNSRLLYIHSFQSLIWNKAASKRINDFGLKPIEGDLVIISDDSTKNLEVNEEINEQGETEEINEQGETEEKVEQEADNNFINKVKVLTKNELDTHSIFDVVLPLPGFDVVYPQNEMREYYEELLKEYNLSLEMPKQKVKTYNISGTYRNIVKKVQNLSWKTLHYDDPNDTLIRSDYEELLGEVEPEDKPNGKFKSVIMDFCLDSSCYATMVLREVLKIDTNTVSHAKLNNYFKEGKETSPVQEENSANFTQEQSLLENKEKYEEFKRLIFSAESGNDNNDIPHKKAKLEDENVN